MYRHLEKNPQYQFYPIFKKFENWCQDESRHGDIFKALLRSQSHMWQGWQAKLLARFFLLSVFATHILTVHERADFYESVGMDAQEYDREVTRKTNYTAGRAFPVRLDVEHPQFFPLLEKCSDYNSQISEIESSQDAKNCQILP